MPAPVPRLRRRLASLAPLTVLALALPLLAPTCGNQQPGLKAFGKGSILIPMDACYQNTGGAAPASGCPSAGGATRDPGDVIRAYGLVYRLVRAGVPVYWVIEPNKASLLGPDVTVEYQAGAPVGKYLWASGGTGAMPPNNSGHSITYRGGPWVVDASDFAAANAVLQSAPVKAQFGASQTINGVTVPAVNLHVSQVAFQGYAAKALSGGWDAGGAVAPKLALLNMPGGDGRYADHVLEGYLIRAGLAPECVLGNRTSCTSDAPCAPYGTTCDLADGVCRPCAHASAGAATPGGHGEIYDRLEAADFLPPPCAGDGDCPAGSSCIAVSGTSQRYCDWRSTRLFTQGYKVLWLPHWTGPNSVEGVLGAGYQCGTGFGGCGLVGGDQCSCVNSPVGNLSAGELDAVLATIGGFVRAGNDLFGECGGIGTLEGVYGAGGSTVNATYADGNAASRFQTSAAAFPAGGGMHITTSVTAPACTADAAGMSCADGELYRPAYYASPFLQIGDYGFTPVSGIIAEYRPATGNGAAGYVTGVDALISRMNGADRYDYFTFRPASETAGGNVVYLGGHDYSGFQGSFSIAGTRLVMNTLFNLASTCVATGLPCSTGLLGACARGTMACDLVGNPVCQATVAPVAETCNGVDDDCDGAVDDDPVDPPGGSPACQAIAGSHPGVGICRAGTWSCQQPYQPAERWVCVGEVGPQPEACNGLDDDCNGTADDVTPPGGSACYTGSADTRGKGICRDGSWRCQGTVLVCQGQQLPELEQCEPAGADENCDGQADENCDCVQGDARPCYGGPAGTAGIGLCRSGVQACDLPIAGRPGAFAWGACAGQVLPAAEACNGLDDDCDGTADEQPVCDACQAGETRACYGGPPATAGVGTCLTGLEPCAGGQWTGRCDGEVRPATRELCNGLDDDCDGAADEDATCGTDLACVNGVCTPPSWGAEQSCGPGYVQGPGNACLPQPCPAAPCPAGRLCVSGACQYPCQGVSCGQGAFCSGGVCVGGGCYATGCTGADAGKVCRGGACVADPCAGSSCPAGTFCRGGDCVQACAFVVCGPGQRCDQDGFCVADPCATVACGPTQTCRGGACVANPCSGVACGERQVCLVVTEGGQERPLCTDDPCSGVVCPDRAPPAEGVVQCIRGQCFAASNPAGYGPPAPETASKSQGCGCGGGDAGPTALLLALLALPFVRRRRPAPSRRGGAVALAVAALAGGAACGEKSSPLSCETCGTSACVDVKLDSAHCGACATACGAGQSCVDGFCLAGSLVAPWVTAVRDQAASSPGPIAAGGSPTLVITGERFQAGAEVRLAGAVAPTAVTPTSVTATQLTAAIDLSGAAAGTLVVRVVNPQRVVSNGYEVTLVTPTPRVTSLSPATKTFGDAPDPFDVAVTGAGFTPGSVCVLITPDGKEQGVPTTYGSPTGLTCRLDLRAASPGTARIHVQNDGGVRSSPGADFEITSGTPRADSVLPSSAQQGDKPRLLVTGASFAPGCAVQLGQGGAWRDLATSYVHPTRLQADADLGGDAPGSYQVRVSCAGGSKVTAPLPFTVAANAPTATGLATTPAEPHVGDADVLLALSGSGFVAGCAVELLRPGAGSPSTSGVATRLVSSTSVQGTLASADLAGTWYASVSCPLGRTAAFPFLVQSNVASVATVAPAGGRQGTTVSLAVAGANFLAGAVVRLTPETGAAPPPVPATVTSSTALAASVDLAGLAAGSYVLTVRNPGAADSNGLAFAVTPGLPSLSATATSGAGCAAAGACSPGCAAQGPEPVTVTLTGANFGQGSTVHATSGAVADLDLAGIPGATVSVVSATRIDVALDAREVPAATYQLSVWNPGSPSVQKSAPLPFRVSSSTCP